jgi:hypothetical protein
VSGYDDGMTEPTSKEAPALGDPTDADLGDETAAFLLNSGTAPAREDGSDAAHVEKTMETPDELGGTGGGQEGGAG